MRAAVRRFEPAVEFDVWLIRPKVARPFNLIDRFTAFALERLADFVANELSARPLEGAPVSG
jgi:hypothetical protein